MNPRKLSKEAQDNKSISEHDSSNESPHINIEPLEVADIQHNEEPEVEEKRERRGSFGNIFFRDEEE